MPREKKELIEAFNTEIEKINVKLKNEDELLNVLQKTKLTWADEILSIKKNQYRLILLRKDLKRSLTKIRARKEK